jgi:hypothetical protein
MYFSNPNLLIRCCPNAYWRWDLDSFAVHLYAARPIAEGEQLSIPYISLLQSHERRQDQLVDRYIFRCTCSICRGKRPERREHDSRRANLGAFVERAHEHTTGPLSRASTDAVVRAISDATAEQYFFADVWSPVLRYATRAALALGDADAATVWAKRAAKLSHTVKGNDGGWARIALAPEDAAEWRSKVGMDDADLSRVTEAMSALPF